MKGLTDKEVLDSRKKYGSNKGWKLYAIPADI